MVIKPLTEPPEYKILRSLYVRMDLPEEDVKNYLYQKKGFEGEKQFDEWLANLPGNWFTLNGLMLKYNNNFFQIDKLVIFQGKLHNINVKNFEGDYYINNGKWHSPKFEIKDPLEQLKRSEGYLKQLPYDLRLDIPIESYLVFVNPEFHLYNAERTLPAIFPTQMNRYKERLLSIPCQLQDWHMRLAEKLVSLHLERCPYTILPEYKQEQLKPGLTCVKCNSFISKFDKNRVVCDKCDEVEDVDSAVLRAVDEFILLFPDKKITVATIYEWCKIFPKRTIRRVLLKYFNLIRLGNSSYYVKK
jgi:hypothetical protein